jgi:hypothetical protein
MFNGKEEAKGGDFEFYDVTSFGDCECPEDEVPFTLNVWSRSFKTEWSLFQQNTLRHYKSWNSIYGLVVDECIPKGCYYLSSFHDLRQYDCVSLGTKTIYDTTYDGESIVSYDASMFCRKSYKFGECSTTTNPLKCEDGSNFVKIEITLGENPWDTYWALMDEGTGNATIFGGGDYEVKGAKILKEICKPANACYSFQILGDANALIFFDGKEIFNTNLKTETHIGDSCPTMNPNN